MCPWSVSCPLGSLGVGAYRVNPLADAVPSSRPLHTARARAALWDAVGRRARSRLAAWTRSFSVRTGVPFFVGSPPETRLPCALVRAPRTHNAIQGVILGPVERLHREPVLGPSHQAELITASLFHSQAQRCRRAQTCKASERAFFTVITAPCEGYCITCSYRDNSCIH